MQREVITTAVLGLVAMGCGVPQEEHQRALDDQKTALTGEMHKLQTDNEASAKKRDSMISGLETEVRRLGGDLKNVRTELGDRTTQLAATTQELAQLRNLRERAEKEAAQFKSLAERLKSMVDSGQLEVTRRKGRISLKLPDKILFPSGSRRLKRKGRAALVSVAEALRDVQDRNFIIAGHTDNVPVKKSFKDNWALSTARAVAVVRLMVDNGVPSAQIAAAGYGEFDPIGDNETKEGRQLNRRLEIILMPKIGDVGI